MESEANTIAGASSIGSRYIVPAAVAVVVVTQVIAFALVVHFIGDWQSRGQFGDLFGVTNSLFSGLAFAGLVYTINLQERQLRLQSAEHRRSDASAQETLRLTSDSVKIAREELRLAEKPQALGVAVTLLNHYESELARIENLDRRSLGSGNFDEKRVQLNARIVRLRAVVNDAYDNSVNQERACSAT